MIVGLLAPSPARAVSTPTPDESRPEAEMLLDLDLLRGKDLPRDREILRRLPLLEQLRLLEGLRMLESEIPVAPPQGR